MKQPESGRECPVSDIVHDGTPQVTATADARAKDNRGHRRKGTLPGPAAPRPSCSPRSTSTKRRNLALLQEEFQNYQAGIMPAGPGARELTDFFASIDAGLDPAQAPQRKCSAATGRSAASSPAPPACCTSAPRLLLVRRPVPGTLPQARRHPGRRQAPHRNVRLGPLPQATDHPATGRLGRARREHSDVPRAARPGAEDRRARLQAEYGRAARVLERIDEAAAGENPESSAGSRSPTTRRRSGSP